MVKMILVTFFLTICSLLKAPEYRTLYIAESAGINPLESIWKAVCTVESDNNVNDLNRKEQAYGIAQIRYIRLHDYNKRTGNHYLLKDMYDPGLSKTVFLYYARQYSDYDFMIMRWNGSGPETYKYLKKVLKILNH